MDVGFIYSSKDPRQLEAKKFLVDYIKRRGILATVKEIDKPVDSPTLVVDGEAMYDKRKKPREVKASIFPGPKDIARFLEHHVWSL